MGETIGERIHLTRRRAHLKQRELAERSGISVAALSKYERDLRDPPSRTLAALAVALGTSADYLIGLTYDEQPRDHGDTKQVAAALRTSRRVAAEGRAFLDDISKRVAEAQARTASSGRGRDRKPSRSGKSAAAR
jgi:transcriptional regulator with XRE-family HTH domain